MGVVDVAPSDSTIEVAHHMSKFNIFIISLDIYCSLSCRQLQIVIALFPAGSYRLLLLSLLQAIAVDYCSYSCRQIATKYCFLSCRQLQNVIALIPAAIVVC